MRRVGVHETRFADASSVDIVNLLAKAKDLEYTLLEIDGERLLGLSPLGCKRISLEARNFQLDLSYSLKLRFPYDLSARDEEVRKQGIAYVEQVIKLIGGMGGGSLNGPFYTSLPPQSHWNRHKDVLFEQSVNSLRTLSIIAEKEDVLLNIRPINRYEHSFLNTASDALQFVRSVNHPNCGIDLDTFHMNIEETDMQAALVEAGYYLHCFHIQENNGRAVEDRGHLDWQHIKEGLDAIHYEGPVIHAPSYREAGNPIASFEGKRISMLLS
ncbi:MAG: TIM barrel protein [Sphaerochaetaceae bacterium]